MHSTGNELMDNNMVEKVIYIIKRSGKRVPFDRVKMEVAMTKANNEEKQLSKKVTDEQIKYIAQSIEDEAREAGRDFTVEEIQDKVIEYLLDYSKSVGLKYARYRDLHNEKRKATNLEASILGITGRTNEEVKQENSNKNPVLNSVQRDYMAGEVSKEITRKFIMPEDIKAAHDAGEIHWHDTDYSAQSMHNCDLVNLEDMLQNGTVLSGVEITKPHLFSTAANIASQAIAQIASSQYGGQSVNVAHLVPFVQVSRDAFEKEVRETYEGFEVSEERIAQEIEKRVDKDIAKGIQCIQYQLITMMTTNGQTPFVTLYMYLKDVPEGQMREDYVKVITEIFKQRIKGLPDKHGNWVTPAFPKLIYVLEDDNTYEGSKYFELTKLAAKCTAKRMVPDYISEKKMLELKGDVYACMGCRSFLTPDRFTDAGIGNIANAKNYVEGQHKYWGRFNQGVVTLNLVDVACTSEGNEETFWKILDERLDLCHRALRIRHERLLGTPSDVAPILWQDGALARLQPGETIDKLLYNGYSTISLGFAGLAETVYRMKGVSHTSEEGKEFGLKVMQALNDACKKWKEAENIDYSVYGTPLESTTYKFAKCLQKKFGKIPGVTDKNYITNSYHIKVTEEIDAFSKLTKEAEFQQLAPGGAISYVEVPNLQNNLEAVIKVMQHIYETILYAELNTKSDFCEECGFDGEIQVFEDKSGYLGWRCPNCGCTDQTKMHVARRTCGYIGSNYWNQGRTQEIKERVLHL